MSKHLQVTIILLSFVMLPSLLSMGYASAQDTGGAERSSAESSAELGKWLQIIKTPDVIYTQKGQAAVFTIVVLNTSDNFNLRDVVVSDPLSPDCNLAIGNILAKGGYSYTCRQPNVQVPFVNEAVVSGINDQNGQDDSATDTARVEVLALAASIEANPENVLVPGGPVTFEVTVTNQSSVGLQLTSLLSARLGDLADPSNGAVRENSCAAATLPFLYGEGDQLACSFVADVAGLPGDQSFDVTATGHEVDENTDVQGSGVAVVSLVETIATTLTAQAAEIVAGGRVQLDVLVENISAATPIILLGLEDAGLGDVRPFGNCVLPQPLAPGTSYACSYQQTATGEIGQEMSFVLDVLAQTEGSEPIFITDAASESLLVSQPLMFLPMMTLVPRPESCALALPIALNTPYLFYPDTRTAFYRFELAETADVTVELTDFVSGDGQLQVFKDTGDGCGPTLERIGFNGDNASDKIVPVGEQEAGTYYIFVFNGGVFSDMTAYTLFVRTSPPS